MSSIGGDGVAGGGEPVEIAPQLHGTQYSRGATDLTGWAPFPQSNDPGKRDAFWRAVSEQVTAFFMMLCCGTPA